MNKIYFLLLLFFPMLCFSQAEKDLSFNLEPKAHYGFIIPHRNGMKNLILGHVKAFELNYDIPTYGKKEWQQLYHYPTWGLSYYFADLANPKQLGFATGIFPYINLSGVKGKKFRFNYHLGWGLGYVSKSFDRLENYKNIVIGSKLNAIISLGAEAEWRVSNRLSSVFGLSFTHFSNGAYSIPNLGINLPSVNAGMSYYFGKTDKEFIMDSIPPPQKKYEISWVAAGGLKSVYPEGSTKKYPAFSLSVTFGSVRSLKNRFLAGFDLFYNTALFDYYKRYRIPIKNNSEMLQPGISLYYMAKISKVYIVTGMGAYIYTKYKLDGNFYHRIGIRYHLNENFFFNLTLKTHFFKADFSQWGIGYKF